MSRRQLAMLVLLAGVWGASFMFIKVGDRELAPITLVWIRLTLGALALAPIVLFIVGPRRAVAELRQAMGPLIVIGLTNSSIPFWFLTWAETRIDSGLAAVIQASAPLFTALLALRFSHGERVTGARLVGLLVGFGGVALLVGVQPSGQLLAGLAVVVSAFFYAVAALYAARTLGRLSPLVTALWALVAASLSTLPFAVTRLPTDVPSWKVTGAMLALGIGGTGLAYILYYGLIAGAGASRSILITYLVPAVALLYGAVFLGEPLTVSAIAGLILVLAGVALGTGGASLARRRRARVGATGAAR